ncbi:MAG: GNAT family N-acetyltransferase [Ruminococcaceae bacterium]|nr:GNAT family N-acetyltransferase [Oscillospiraceae bacterium]
MILELAQSKDKRKIAKLDRHIPSPRLGECIWNQQVYVLKDDSIKNGGQNHRLKDPVVGVLRYSLFWETIPFLNLLYIDASYRNKGFGTEMMRRWEDTMARMGYKYVMTSTQADEDAWVFYEKLGYQRVGGFFPPEQAVEEWMYLKRLDGRNFD